MTNKGKFDVFSKQGTFERWKSYDLWSIPVNFVFQLFVVFQLFIQESLNFSDKVACFLKLLFFRLVNKFLQLKNFKSNQAMNMKFSVYYVEAIIYLMLYNLYDCAFEVFTIGLLYTTYSLQIVVRKIGNFPNISNLIIYFLKTYFFEVLNSKTI